MLENLLRWYSEIGADEAIGDRPINRFVERPGQPARPGGTSRTPDPVPALPPAANGRPLDPHPAEAAPGRTLAAASARGSSPAAPTPGPTPGPMAVEEARHRAGQAETLSELMAAIHHFNGCGLKTTATQTVFADGNPAAPVMLLGDVPGSEEDRTGTPFAGATGRLLDRMLAAIQLDRGGVYLSNVVFWRPPGNRTPTPAEIEICLPFTKRHIELAQPKLLILAGSIACQAMLATKRGITRLRGSSFQIREIQARIPIQAFAMYHPSFLLNSPERKQETWQDLLLLKSLIEEVTK